MGCILILVFSSFLDADGAACGIEPDRRTPRDSLNPPYRFSPEDSAFGRFVCSGNLVCFACKIPAKSAEHFHLTEAWSACTATFRRDKKRLSTMVGRSFIT